MSSGSGPTQVVLAVVRCGDRICVARRSQAVATSRGLWSVVTGYLEPGAEPEAFLVHPFLFECPSSRVVLNWEHDAVPWVDSGWLDQAGCVPWQAEVVRALLADG